MEKYLYHLDVNTLKGKGGLSKDKTFEFLCKAILEKHYNFSEGFIIGSNDSGVECPAIKDSDGKYHTFQAKFSKKSTPLLVESFFSEKMAIKNLKLKDKDTLKIKIKENNLDILHIFYLGGVDDKSKRVIEEKLQLFYPNLTVIRYKSEKINDLLAEINYINIVDAFFSKDQFLETIHIQDKQVAQSLDQDKIREKILEIGDNCPKIDMTSYFKGHCEEKDIDLAHGCYDKYLLTKYSFAMTPSFKYFEKIESYIEEDKFEDLKRHTTYNKVNFFGLLKYFTDELSKIPPSRSEKTSIDLLLDQTEPRKGLLINSAVHNKCIFEFIDEERVLFNIVKSDE